MSGKSRVTTGSRQKSCVACVEGKRRCNRQTPQCSRCLAQGLDCAYRNGRPPRKHPQTPSEGQLEPSSQISGGTPFSWPPNDPLLEDTSAPLSWPSPSPSLLTILSLPPVGFLFPETSVLDRWSINQLSRSIKTYPMIFSCSGSTPFIHHRLYDSYLPDAIQDAFTVCSAYCTKSPETEDMVFRILENKVSSLASQDHHHRTSSRDDLLAAVQALLLFQIIQLFDGDIRQRSLAEQNQDILRTWTFRLQALSSPEPEPASTVTWQEWIITESVRRTVIVSMMFDGLYLKLKTGRCPNIRALSVLPFTVGAGLWDVNTNALWLARSNALRTDTVLYGDFANAWERGQASGELEGFQKLLLIPCMGEGYREVLELYH